MFLSGAPPHVDLLFAVLELLLTFSKSLATISIFVIFEQGQSEDEVMGGGGGAAATQGDKKKRRLQKNRYASLTMPCAVRHVLGT